MASHAHITRIILATAATAALSATAACGSSQAGTAEPSAATDVAVTAQAATTVDDMRTALHDTASNSEPLETVDPTPAAHTIHNEADADYGAGNYRLTVLCMGQGTLEVKWELGDTGQESDAIGCTPDITTRHYGIQLEQPATGSQIELVPQTDTDATMAYRLDRVTDAD